MRIEQATAFLYSLNPKGIRFGLENTRLVLDRLGRPQDRFASVHLAGSNGKGSTAAFLESMLRRAGLRVGLYSSPHLNHFRERFRIDGRAVPDAAIGEMIDRLLADGLEVDPREVQDWIEREDMIRRMAAGSWYVERGAGSEFCRLTFFECTTVLAFLLFARFEVELAVVETGMGGRLDATNVLAPRVSVITPIHLEHTAWLGDTVGAIAAEKAGIIKPGVPVVCAPQRAEARTVIERAAAERDSPVSWVGEQIEVVGDWLRARFRVAEHSFGPLRLGLAGTHQLTNAAVALGCLPHLGSSVWPPAPGRVAAGLGQVEWPGRFERLGQRGEWILDAAHNPAGARALAETLREVVGDRRLRLVFGVLGDKAADDMLRVLQPLAEQVHLVRSADARGRDPRELLPLVSRSPEVHDSVRRALEVLLGNPGGPVVVTGSLTVVGEARAWLLESGFGPTQAGEPRSAAS